MVRISEALCRRVEGFLLVLEMKQRLWYYIALKDISSVVNYRWFIE